MPKKYRDIDVNILGAASLAWLCLVGTQASGYYPLTLRGKYYTRKFALLCKDMFRELRSTDSELNYNKFKFYIKGFRSFKEKCSSLIDSDAPEDNGSWYFVYIRMLELFEDMCDEPKDSVTIERYMCREISSRLAWTLINNKLKLTSS